MMKCIEIKEETGEPTSVTLVSIKAESTFAAPLVFRQDASCGVGAMLHTAGSLERTQ